MCTFLVITTDILSYNVYVNKIVFPVISISEIDPVQISVTQCNNHHGMTPVYQAREKKTIKIKDGGACWYN